MTIKATKFTPEVLLSAPRRSAASPNPTGTSALYMVSSYSFADHRKTVQMRLLDIKSGQSTLLFQNPTYSEPTWIGETEFLFLKSGDRGCTYLMLGDASKPGSDPKEIRCFPGSISNLKAKPLPDGSIAIACSAPATPAGHMHNPEADKKPHSTAQIYTSLYVRHWDSYDTPNRSAIWYGCLKRDDNKSSSSSSSSSYTIAGAGLINALAGTGLECPVPPFGGASEFDLGPRGIAFVSRDPTLNPATHTKSDVYFLPLASFAAAAEDPPPRPQPIRTGHLLGYAASPVFSPDGRSLAFTKMRSRQYESDKARLMLVPDVDDLSAAQEFYETADGEGAWDVRPEALAWSLDGAELYVSGESRGRGLLWKLPSSPARAAAAAGDDDNKKQHLPRSLVSEGTVGDFRPFGGAGPGETRLLLSCSSLIDSSYYCVLDPAGGGTLDLVSSHSKQGRSFGLSRAQCSDIWFRGAGDYDVHALVMKPSDFDESRSYPLAVLIHGGPQNAWMDSWSTRWNPAVFAERGYVVVTPNPTGSSGYGMDFQNGIRDQWGGRPYLDLEKCFEYIEENMPYVDTSRAVAAGASYGGYMINWIQGNPLGRKFKALVCHDGVFSTLQQYTSEELFFPVHDFGGTLWENREGYEKWDPAKLTGNWATPELIIHNELDYRLPVTEGIAMFNVLQSRGVPSKFLYFPDENHWVLKPENSLVWHREVLDWFDKYAKAKESSDSSKLAERPSGDGGSA